MDRIFIFHFTDNLEIRKFAPYRGCPVSPEKVWHVLPGIHANTVQARRADPPQSVLDQVTRNFHVVLVEVRQKNEEPTLHRLAIQARTRMRIVQRPDVKYDVYMTLLGSVDRGRHVR